MMFDDVPKGGKTSKKGGKTSKKSRETICMYIYIYIQKKYRYCNVVTHCISIPHGIMHMTEKDIYIYTYMYIHTYNVKRNIESL